MRSLFAAVVATLLLAGCSPGGGAGGATCGDGLVGAPEVCDGAALAGQDCTSVAGGFAGGALACAADCLAFDTAGCAAPACGDGLVTAPEVCDGVDLGGQDCTTVPGGYVGGVLACAAGCLGHADGRCQLSPGPTCAAAGRYCFRLMTAQGAAEFEASCPGIPGTYDAAGTCPLDGAHPGYCELPDLAFLGVTPPGAAARAYFYSPEVHADQALGLCGMIGGTWAGLGAWRCGDGAVTAVEACDGADLRGASCVSLGALSGALACAADCLTYDVAACGGVVSCLMRQGTVATCGQDAWTGGVPSPSFYEQYRADCEARPGTYAAGPCPTEGRIGYCDAGSGSWLVYYEPFDPAVASFTCALSRGTWVTP